MKKKNIIITISLVSILAVTAVIGTMVGLSNTVGELSSEIHRNQVDAILANAKVEDASIVSMPVVYYDQTMDECVNMYDLEKAELLKSRQFEWSGCGYHQKAYEKELTEPKLDQNYLPVAREGGNLLPNRGLTQANFARWFNAVEGKSQSVASKIDFRYDGDIATFAYENNNFYPLNNIVLPAETVNADNNNHLFTMNLGVPIEVMGEGKESFSISADDDTWVYINDDIVLDMGGVHGVMTGKFKIQENGEVYTAVEDEDLAYSGVKLEKGKGAIVRIFHADRDSTESVMRMSFSNTLVNVVNSVLAKSDMVVDGTTVAYNPDEPAYVAPLGESLTYTPDRSKMILTSVVTQASVMGALIMVIMMVISVVLRYLRRDRNQE